MTTLIYDQRICSLGEGPLWHPTRKQLFWFDILNHKMLSQDHDGPLEWQFEESVSAAGWIDDNTLLVASESMLMQLNLTTGDSHAVAALEADRPDTRSNDGRADPWGGFWISTMGKQAEPQAGAIYRYYQGSIRKIVDGISIPNAICFCPDRRFAYYTDTPTQRVMRQHLDEATGWPSGAAHVFLDLSDQHLNPDGAVVDTTGNIWLAQWGAARVAAYNHAGRFVRAVPVAARNSSCPAFGGEDLDTLFCTSAAHGVSNLIREHQPSNGMVFCAPGVGTGQAEHRVVL
ncbi:MAG: SMP-30/gluconolactonase/LRE family protein [Sedimentitalea sp.]